MAFSELSNQRGIDALAIAFRADFAGDRVFAFGVGIGSMIAQAYNDKSSFYITDSLDAQRLYNAARNLEIAAGSSPMPRDPTASCCSSATRSGAGARQSVFEREFGKLIAYQDALALVMAQRTNRTIRRCVANSRDGGVPAAVTRVIRACDDDAHACSLEARGEALRRGRFGHDHVHVGERANPLELILGVFRAIDEQDRLVRSLGHCALDRAPLRVGIGNTLGRHAAGTDEGLVRLEPP
jgi:hypothetical protein